MNVAFIGLGKLGLPIAEVMAQKHRVQGYDISARTSHSVRIQKNYQDCIRDTEIIFIAVPTPHHKDYDGSRPSTDLPPKDFDYSFVKEVLAGIAPHLQKNQMVVLISTVLPGTTRREFAPLIPNNEFIYNPYLIAMGTEQHDFLNPEMVIMGAKEGADSPALGVLKEFYQTMMKPDTRYCTGSWEDGEGIKIFYNTFISAKIGLVNMIQDVAEKLNHMNVDRVTDALANSDYRIISKAYMKAGMGDGGPCHPRDNIALKWLSQSLDLGYDLFGSIMNSRDMQAKNMAKTLLKIAPNVIILGKSFKPDVAYTDGSYSVLVGEFVKQLGGQVRFFDPKIPVNELPSAVELEVMARAKEVVFLVSYWEEWVYEFPFPEGSMVLDPWRKPLNLAGVKWIPYGDTFHKKRFGFRKTNADATAKVHAAAISGQDAKAPVAEEDKPPQDTAFEVSPTLMF